MAKKKAAKKKAAKKKVAKKKKSKYMKGPGGFGSCFHNASHT